MENYEAKQIELFSRSTEAWFKSRTEFDRIVYIMSILGILKSMVTLSAGIAAILFMLSLSASLAIFRLNCAYIEKVNNSQDTEGVGILLRFFDIMSVACMAMGYIILIIRIWWPTVTILG